MIFKNVSQDVIELLKGMLTLDHTKRMTAAQALAHPFFSVLHNDDDEPTTTPPDHKEFEFEKYELTREQLKGKRIRFNSQFNRFDL